MALLVVVALAVLAGAQEKKVVSLPSSKILLTPVPGEPQPTNSFPVNMALSPDGRYLAILNAGYGAVEFDRRQSVAVLDLQTNKLTEFPDDRLGRRAAQTFFLGIAFSLDGQRIYVPMSSISDPEGEKEKATGNGIAVYQFKDGQLTPNRFIKIPLQSLAKGKTYAALNRKVPPGKAIPYPAGITNFEIAGREQLLLANNLSDDAIVLDSDSGEIRFRFDLSSADHVPASYPYMVLAHSGRAWCSLWNSSDIAELDLMKGKVLRRIQLLKPKDKRAAGSHPTAMLLSPDSRTLYVTLSNSDAVAVIDAVKGKLIGYLSARLPGQKYLGSQPNALAQSPDGKTLYVALAASDAVAVFDLATARPEKDPARWPQASWFIPTEWYPTAIAVHNGELLIASAKAKGMGTNVISGRRPTLADRNSYNYIMTLQRGSIARVNLEQAAAQRTQLTQEVLESNLMTGHLGQIKFASGRNPIRHVIYVIKENRTYDQVLGDLGVGDGDPNLTLYGADITPNIHKLARQFGVLDNFYDSGEVSGDGHVWSTAAIGSDYTEKTIQIGYRGSQRTYDYEGLNANEYPMERGIPDVNEPQTGYIWTLAARHKLTYRHYGEFVSTLWCHEADEWQSPTSGTPLPSGTPQCTRKFINRGDPLPSQLGGGPSPYPWAIPVMSHNVPTKPELRGHYDPLYPDFNTDFPDQLRADEFLREFNAWVAARQPGKPDPMPNMIVLRLPNDHTTGTSAGHARPTAAVADNDLALGRIVDAISHSAYWDDTAILVLEDDAQDGADHVDAHRSTALVISKYSPGSPQQPFVDHGFYTTVNMIRTMEELLGLPPMNNNDARAAVMAPLFAGPGTQLPFTADYRNRDNGMILEINQRTAPGARQSSEMNFRTADSVDSAALNQILWRDRKGDDSAPPEPRHSVFPH